MLDPVLSDFSRLDDFEDLLFFDFDPDFFDDPRIVWCRYTEWPQEARVREPNRDRRHELEVLIANGERQRLPAQFDEGRVSR